MPQDTSSALRQQIGSLLDEAVLDLLRELSGQLDFDLMPPDEGKHLLHLTPTHGIEKQIDHIITAKGQHDPLVLVEIKWLKDSRHIYDKGGWIEGLDKIKQRNPTIRGAVALLAGYWSQKILQQLELGSSVRSIVLLDVEEMYSLLRQHGIDIQIDKKRNAVANPNNALDQILRINSTTRHQIKTAIVANRRAELERALNDLLTPVAELAVVSIEVSLRVNQGNVVAKEFTYANEAIEFISQHTGPDAPETLRRVVKESGSGYKPSLLQDD